MSDAITSPSAHTVILYSQPSCGPCVGVKTYLKNAKVPFVELNIREDAEAAARVAELGYRGTPVVEYSGGHFHGYIPEELEKLKPVLV